MPRVAADAPVDRLASFLSALRFEALPADVVEKTKVHIADTIGSALAGARSAEVRIARRAAGAPGSALIWGTGDRAAAREAALINGVAAHAFERTIPAAATIRAPSSFPPSWPRLPKRSSP